MATPQGWSPIAEPTGWTPVAESAAPTFRTANEKDASGAAVVRPGGVMQQVGEFLGEATSSLNPIKINQALQAAFWDTKGTVKGLVSAQDQVRQAAHEAFQRGDYVTGIAKTIDWLIPVLGPRLSAAGDDLQRGDIGKGLGKTVDVAAQALAPAAARRISSVRVPAVMSNRNPVEAAAVDFGVQHGVPLDAATATGNSFIRGVQKLADESLGGSVTAERAKAAQHRGLATVGEQLAAKVHPDAVTPEQAGQALRDAVESTMEGHHATASAAYERLRAIEKDWTHAADVPAPLQLTDQMKARMRTTTGSVPSTAELHELARIHEEMDAVPFQAGRLSRDQGAGFDSGDTTYSPRAAGAPVYHDILQDAPAGTSMTRAEVKQSISAALETGHFNNAARGALAVAKKRLSDGGADYAGISRPILPPDAGVKTQGMLLPVDLREAKVQLKPLYDDLMREKDITPLMGAKGQALVSLDRLMTAPDHAPVSIVDAALSDLKALARKTTGRGQHIARQAVQNIDAAVQLAVAKAGPEAVQALETGRRATRDKYATLETFEKLRDEPVQAFRQAIAPKDSGVALLRDLQQRAPEALPKIGRAYLDDLMNTATAEGGFDRTARLASEWQKMGPETKRLLFQQPAYIASLDHFFLLAKRLAANPNPSGTALTLWKGGELTGLMTHPAVGIPYSLSMAAMSKLLHSPTGVKLLTRGLSLPVGNKVAVGAWVTELMKAVGESATPVPAAAQADRAASGESTPQR